MKETHNDKVNERHLQLLLIILLIIVVILTQTLERCCDFNPSAESGVHAYLVQCAKSHSTGSPLLQMKTLKIWTFGNKWWTDNVSHVHNGPVYGRMLGD